MREGLPLKTPPTCGKVRRCDAVRFRLPGLGAVAAGAGRGHLGVAGQGPGVRRRLEPLHVPSEEGEQSGGGVGGRLAALALQQLHQEVDVAHGQAQDLVLAQLLLRWVGGDELAELGEGRVDVVLAPALPRVGEHLPGHGAERGWSDQTRKKIKLKSIKCPFQRVNV